MWYVLIAYGLLIGYAIWRVEANMMKDVSMPKEEKDPYEDYRDPATGLLRSRPWKKK